MTGVTLAAHDDLSRCFDQASVAFEDAASRVGTVDRNHRIAGCGVLVRYAGDAIHDALAPALAHHPPADPGAPALTVLAWDARSTGSRLPSLPGGVLDGGTDWRTRTADVGRFRVLFDEQVRALSLLDRQRGLAIFCTVDADTVPYWERTEPFRVLLHWWLGERGRQLVHAAGVASTDGGVVIVGPSGAGKSTTALACLAHSDHLCYLGDDHCVVALDPEPTVFGLYGLAKLDAAQAERLPELAGVCEPAVRGEPKAVFRVTSYAPDRIGDHAPLRAVGVARISGERATRVEPLAAGRALAALAPNTILQLPGAAQSAWATFGRLVRAVPAYTVHLGTDLRTIPPALEQLIADGRR